MPQGARTTQGAGKRKAATGLSRFGTWREEKGSKESLSCLWRLKSIVTGDGEGGRGSLQFPTDSVELSVARKRRLAHPISPHRIPTWKVEGKKPAVVGPDPSPNEPKV